MTLEGALLVLLWGTAAVRLPTVWRDRRQRALWITLCALALAKTCTSPPMLPHLFGLLAAFFLLRFLTMVTGAGRRRWPPAVTAGVLVALGTLALVSGGIHTRAELLSRDLPPSVVAYWVVLELYLGAVLVAATVLFGRVARHAPAGLPRLGMWSIAVGLALIATYAAVKTVLIVAHGFGAGVDFPAIAPVADLGRAVGTILAVVGAVVPTGRRARSVWSAYRSLLALRPLWKAMRDAFPEVILFTPRRAAIELAGVDDVHLRLYRRVIEIRDGMLALRAYLPEDPPAAADPAQGEATAIALALARKQRGEPPVERPGGWQPVGPEMADEVAWLSRVSRARVTARDAAPTPTPSGSAR